jgi:hypothetical protein
VREKEAVTARITTPETIPVSGRRDLWRVGPLDVRLVFLLAGIDELSNPRLRKIRKAK